MLDALRRGSTGWVAKILFALLVLSFAVWGVADVFTGFGRGSLAKVGSHEIHVEDFQRTFQNELSVISRQSGRRITAEQARAAGLDHRILQQLMAWAAVESHAADLDLALSDEAIINSLKNDPAFKGPDEKFSRIAFENVLNQMGRERARLPGAAPPRRAARAADVGAGRRDCRARHHDRAGQRLARGEARRRVFHDRRREGRHGARARRGEAQADVLRPTRAISSCRSSASSRCSSCRPNGIKSKMEVTDDEIAASYRTRRTSTDTPERRRLQQIAFKDKARRRGGQEGPGRGRSFGTIAREAGAKDADIDLGVVTRKSMIDPKIADAAFALKKDEVSDPVEGRFATVLLRVTDIQPAVTRTLADVKDQVRDKLARTKAEAQLQTLLDQVEDQRLAGKSLKEVADLMKLEFIEIPATDRLTRRRRQAGEHARGRHGVARRSLPEPGTGSRTRCWS